MLQVPDNSGQNDGQDSGKQEQSVIYTFGELAAALGLSEPVLRRYKGQGCPIHLPTGGYDYPSARRWLDANKQPKAGSRRSRMLAAERQRGDTSMSPGCRQDVPSVPQAEEPASGEIPEPRTWVEKSLQVRVRKDAFEAELRGLKLALQRGELVPLEAVKQFGVNRITVFRSVLLGDLPRRIAQATHGLGVKESERTVRAEFRRVLEALAGGETAEVRKPRRGRRPAIAG